MFYSLCNASGSWVMSLPQISFWIVIGPIFPGWLERAPQGQQGLTVCDRVRRWVSPPASYSEHPRLCCPWPWCRSRLAFLCYIVFWPTTRQNILVYWTWRFLLAIHSTFNLLIVQRFSEKNYIDFAASSHPIDISSMLFQSTKERLLYGVLLISSFFSVCISFSK